MKKVTRKVGRYEVGRTIGEGTFAKFRFAQNTDTGESVAMKVMAKSTIPKHKMVDQIKREISIMKIVRNPNIVRLHEVLASRTKIYIVLEFVTRGELFDRIGRFIFIKARLSENEPWRYFQQLIDVVAHCHSKGVYHRDLKPENLLLDSNGNLTVSDFGLSALPQQRVEILCSPPIMLHLRRFSDGGIFIGNLRRPIEEVMPKLEQKLTEAAGREVVLWFMEEKINDITKQICMVQPKSEMDLQFESTKLSTTWGYVSAVALCVTTFGSIALMSGFFLKPDAFDDYLADVVPLFGGILSILGVTEVDWGMKFHCLSK